MSDSSPQTYTLEILAETTGVSTQTIVQYQEHGLIRPEFDDETIRALRRIEHLRETCEMNLTASSCSRNCSMKSSNSAMNCAGQRVKSEGRSEILLDSKGRALLRRRRP
jgi:DNA-binding transcriptional MerR regulator